MKKKKILTYPTSNRGELSYDLNEKRFNFTHIDFFRQYTYFPFSISHIYQNKDINHGYGKGFLLNLEQTLTKIEGTSKYKLSLPDGSEELFEEIYYYKNEKDQRVYKTDDGLPLQRKDITVIEDGSLRYNEHLIYVDLKSNTGLTLKSDYKDFIGSKEMDFRNEDLISLELEIEQIKQNIEDLEYQCEEYQKYEKTEYHTVEEAKKVYQSASQAVSKAQLDSYNFEKKEQLIAAKDDYYKKISMEDQEIGGLILNPLYDEPAYGRILYDKTKKRFTYKNEYGSLALLCEVTSKYEDREYDELDKTILLQDFCNEEFSEEVARLNQALQDISFKIEQDDLKHQKSLFALQNDLSDKEKDYLAKQESYDAIQINRIKDYYQILKERTETQITQNKNLLKQKEYQKEQYLKQIPELFLYNEDGIVYGYNTFGNLCVLFDAYEHQAFIEFNDRNQIKDIIDTNQHKIEFIYNGKNQLIRMIDDENQFIDFIYEKEYLSQFVYSNGKKFTLKYANHNLAEVLDIDSLGYQLEYNNACLSSIQFISVSNNAYCLDEKISFQYLENQILVSNQTNSIKTHYLFDEENSLTTEYIEKEDKLDSIQSYEYGSDHCSFAMMSTPQDAKVLDVNEITFSASKQFEVLPLNSYTTDYLLYAFVQADSMDDIRKRRVTAYCSHDFANQNSARRFELRCVLQYDSYYKEYSVSFNPKIKGTQFAAIPITFDENSNGQVILPNEINVYVDYIGNKGSCEIQHLAMAQGEYTYCEYDEAHHKIFECTSETVSVKNEILEKKGHFVQKKEIEYQYNPKELLEHQISRIRYEEYDVDAMLVQQKQKEEKITLHYNQQNKVVKQIDSNGNVVDYVYNNQGDCIQKKSYRLCMPNMAYIKDQEYDEDGKSISETNDLGYRQTIQYLNHTPVSVTTPGGNVLYMNTNDTATSISTDVDGVENYNTCIYQDGRLTEYQAEGMTYRYTYDEFGREKEIFINNELYCSFIRTKTTTMISYKTLYKDHNGYEKITDVYDRVLKINRIKNDRILPYIVYEYDTKDRIVKETHYKDQQEETLEYLYIEDTLVGIRNTQYTKTSAVDILGNLIEERYQTEDTTYQYTYSYDEENRLNGRSYSVNDDHILSEQYSYDSLNRIKEIENPILKNKFTYLSKNGRTTNLISTQQKQIGSHHQNNSYTYDKEGNIIRKLENHQITSYTYDSLHRLIREDNEALNQTIFYRYDSNGNIQSKEIYDYTQSEHLENKRNIQYNYSDFNDYLTQVNGREIKYDSIGNPILYKDMILEWDHKELKQYGDIHYTYDTNHIRTQKKTKDKTIEYILDGTRILKEIHTYYPTQLESYIDEYSTIDTYREEIEYIYGQEGIIGFDHIKGNERKRYLYNKNILGDILEIYDEEKNLVGKYSYDGYGNQKIEVNIHDIANINPIRYRSYYYDSETSLYLVTTRYYNPEWCRFISPDSIEYLDPSNINGMNLYAYCNNDPVNKIDPSGCFAISTFLISLAIGALVSWGLSEIFGEQIAGGIGSVAGGGTAVWTGISLLAFGPVGWVSGAALILIGAGTIAFGANEIVAGATGTNYIQQWTGMSNGLYNGVYIGLNIASTIGSIAGNAYMKYANVTGNNAGTKGKPFSRYSTIDDNGIKQYRFFDSKGNAWFDKDFRHTGPSLKFPHYHGWINGVRVKDHWTLWELIRWLF